MVVMRTALAARNAAGGKSLAFPDSRAFFP